MKKFSRTSMATAALFVLAAVLLAFGGINAIQAAPRIESSDYRAQVQLSNINVAVTENGDVKRNDDELLTDLLSRAGDEQLVLGKNYDEVLSVRNTRRPDSTNEGEGIEEYVRVSVYRYWTDENGKAVNLNPGYIKLNFLTDNGWTIDEAASTPERTVLYYIGSETAAGEQTDEGVLPVDATAKPFADKIMIDSAVSTAISQGNYDYDNVNFHVKVTADAVQTHNGTEAMVSAWGRTNK